MLNSLVGIIASSGGAAAANNSYESIATVTLSSAASSIDFTSIPSTYQHLQIRFMGAMTSGGADDLRIQFNGDTGSNYTRHYLFGSGSSAGAGASSSIAFGAIGVNTLPTTSNTFGVAVVDVLDYDDTNKYKTLRALAGYDANGSGYLALSSSLWQSTAAITSIKLYPISSTFPQYSTAALYGIKG